MAHIFMGFEPYKGDIEKRLTGSLVSLETGTAFAYSLNKLQDRGRFFIDDHEDIYEGQVIGEHSRAGDLAVNVTKPKKLTNIRASGTDEAIRLVPPIQLTLESAVEFINDDELAEITPKSIRIRKRWLKEFERRRAARGDSRVGPGI